MKYNKLQLGEINLSKFDRYKKKKSESYVFPHKHCQKCEKMIEESLTYCSECHEQMKAKKKKKKKVKEKSQNDSKQKKDQDY